MEEKSAFGSFELEIKDNIKAFLQETSKWTYFLSILGFVGIGLMLVGGVFASIYSTMNNFGETSSYDFGYYFGIGMVYVILALVYFFPILYLFKFSTKMKKALKMSNNEDFSIAFANLKSHYKYMGVCAIVIISLYVIIFIGAMAGASFI